jgi:VRR-NUC domain
VGTVRRPEEQLQRSVVDLLRLYEARGSLTFTHCPNGGYRTPAEAGMFRSLGVRAGIPDLLVWLPSGGHFQIELKAGAGKLSPAQIAWHATITNLGHRVYVCRSVDDVERCLRMESIPPVGTLAVAISAGVEESTGVQERAR